MLAPPTEEFCRELLLRARHYGWSGDYVEVEAFVVSICRDAGIELKPEELLPIDDVDDD